MQPGSLLQQQDTCQKISHEQGGDLSTLFELIVMITQVSDDNRGVQWFTI